MRIVVWNMARNSTTKSMVVHDRAWHYLAALDPDVALVQEATIPEWASERWAAHSPSPNWWGSAVVAKSSLEMTPNQDATPHALAVANIASPDGEMLLVISVYAPPVPATEADLAGRDPASVMLPGTKTANAPDAAFAVARDLATDRFLAAGDWNMSPKLWDQHYPGTRGAAFFTRAREAGWVDCYRKFHDDEGRTWFKDGQRHYQFDHAFCDAQTATTLRSCDIDPYPAEVLRLSDHAPLVVDLKASAAGGA